MAASKRLKRKRDEGGEPGGAGPEDRSAKQAKHVKGANMQRADVVKHALLAQYYPKILSLREYVLSKLPNSSRIRRKKIASVGQSLPNSERPPTRDELALGQLLDTTLVGFQDDAETRADRRWEQWIEFSQRGDESYVTLSDGVRGAVFSQSEIVDFAVWLLFSRAKGGLWPKHLLCDGFRKHAGSIIATSRAGTRCGIPGIFSIHPNYRVLALKESPWPELLLLLGQAGEQVMIDLLLDCAIFAAVEAGRGNLYQLSGVPISDLESLPDTRPASPAASRKPAELPPSEITFMRSRMLYARAALNARGLVHFGLRHIHVLNRFPCKSTSETGGVDKGDESTVHVMMYMFPRQFGLHNAFTTLVDRQQTSQKFQDYTLREEEIAQKHPKTRVNGQSVKPHVPKRLRGSLQSLVRKLQVLHGRCSYSKMLQHYCPVLQQHAETEMKGQPNAHKPLSSQTRTVAKTAKGRTKSRQPTSSAPALQYRSLVELATPTASVSAFCRAVLSKVIPIDFWGHEAVQEHNKRAFLEKVDHFIHLRRFESMSLHEVMQGMKIVELEWLTPPGLANKKCSNTDMQKRTEIFSEFLYYVFDSLLIPLIRSNFYVTEANLHRHRVFFFRHDVWRYIAEPAMAGLKAKMFEEVRLEDALNILDSRRLSHSQLRLLPKETTMRPIMNLRRRTILKNKKKMLGPSINAILSPVNTMLKLEKSLNPKRLGASMFSVGHLYERVKAFKSSLGPGKHQFFFAKIDVQAAFDTIPQEAVVELMKRIPNQSQYRMSKHVEVQPANNNYGNVSANKATKRWHQIAKAAGDVRTFRETLEEGLATNRKNTVFVDSVVETSYRTDELLALMASHIEQNIVRIGKKYYRQKKGIPQGSVLSSLLCNYFYADLEKRHLPFLKGEDCLLLRLIDDFLLITTDKRKASRFVGTMHRGLPDYGVVVSPAKSLVNFDLVLQEGGTAIPKLGGGGDQRFPYCGALIDCTTLEVSKQRDNVTDPVIFNSLTVEYSRHPGQNFKRKVINAFKIQSHLMFFDTSHNTQQTVLANAYTAFVETATKMWAYARCLPRGKQPSARLVIDTIKNLVEIAFSLLNSKSRRLRYPEYRCSVRKTQLSWIAMVACRQVLMKKQTGYKDVLAWLEEETRKVSIQKGVNCELLVKVVQGVNPTTTVSRKRQRRDVVLV